MQKTPRYLVHTIIAACLAMHWAVTQFYPHLHKGISTVVILLLLTGLFSIVRDSMAGGLQFLWPMPVIAGATSITFYLIHARFFSALFNVHNLLPFAITVVIIISIYFIAGLFFKQLLLQLTIVSAIVIFVTYVSNINIGGELVKTANREAPRRSVKVTVITGMNTLNFRYENFISDSLVLCKDKPYSFTYVSTDKPYTIKWGQFNFVHVALPNSIQKFWFIPLKEGKYSLSAKSKFGFTQVQKTESFYVFNNTAYNNWKQKITAPANKTSALTDTALTILKKHNCMACHSTDDTKLLGPSFKGLFGKTQKVFYPDSVVDQKLIDEDYLIQSIQHPDAFYTEGYRTGLMISYDKEITDYEMEIIIEYLKNKAF